MTEKEITPEIFLAWVGTDSPNDDFEVIASWFYSETGYLMPGKDCRLHSYDKREEVRKAWRPSARKRMAEYARSLFTVRLVPASPAAAQEGR